MTRRTLLAALALLALLVAVPAAAAVPVHLRVIKGSRQGPAQVDPRLEGLKRQLGATAYVRWEQTDERRLTLAKGKTEFLTLPDGDVVGVTVQEERGGAVTLEFAITARNTQSRITVEKGQRIVHQVTAERNGAAMFVTVMIIP